MKEQNISDSLNEAIVSYYTNQLTQVQAEELIAWLNKGEENMRHFHEVGALWYASSQLQKKESQPDKGWENLLDRIDKNGIRTMPKPEFRMQLSVLYRIAAVVLLLMVVGIGGFLVFRNPKAQSDSAFFEALAPKGSRSFITLSDGSTVWLNSGTKLRYQSNFGKETRDLFLEGEAYFEVTKNPDMPFRVRTSDVCITALGTDFNVKAYNDENFVETTLERGEVRIEALNPSKNKPESSTVFLKPNQKAIFNKCDKNLSIDRPLQKNQIEKKYPEPKIKTPVLRVDTLVDTKLSTSWKDSRWIFKSKKLLDLTPILERRYDITITFRDSVLSNYKFTGTLKEESLEQVLNAVCLAAPIRYEVIHNQVLFYEDTSQKNKYHKPFTK